MKLSKEFIKCCFHEVKSGESTIEEASNDIWERHEKLQKELEELKSKQ